MVAVAADTTTHSTGKLSVLGDIGGADGDGECDGDGDG